MNMKENIDKIAGMAARASAQGRTEDLSRHVHDIKKYGFDVKVTDSGIRYYNKSPKGKP